MDLRIRMGSSMLVSGPTGSGKTSFILNMLDADMFNVKPLKVHWFSNTSTELHNTLLARKYIVRKALPDSFEYIEPNSVIVIDDFMGKTRGNEGVSSLFTQLAHHKHILFCSFHNAKLVFSIARVSNTQFKCALYGNI